MYRNRRGFLFVLQVMTVTNSILTLNTMLFPYAKTHFAASSALLSAGRVHYIVLS